MPAKSTKHLPHRMLIMVQTHDQPDRQMVFLENGGHGKTGGTFTYPRALKTLNSLKRIQAVVGFLRLSVGLLVCVCERESLAGRTPTYCNKIPTHCATVYGMRRMTFNATCDLAG